MSAEIRVGTVQIVYNPHSGEHNGVTVNELRKLDATIPVFGLGDARTTPEKLTRPNTIVIGDTPTVTETASLIQGLIIPLAESVTTSGQIHRSLGFDRQDRENSALYVRRIMNLLSRGSYDIRRIDQGMIHRAHPYEDAPLPFVFSAGVGEPAQTYMAIMNTLRGSLPKRFRDFFRLYTSLSTEPEPPIFTVVHNKKNHAVSGALIVKAPFLDTPMIPMLDRSRDVMMTINYFPNRSGISRIALDAFHMMILGISPKLGGISRIPLSHDAPVYIHTPHQTNLTTQIDGAHHREGAPVQIIGSKDTRILYRFADISTFS